MLVNVTLLKYFKIKCIKNFFHVVLQDIIQNVKNTEKLTSCVVSVGWKKEGKTLPELNSEISDTEKKKKRKKKKKPHVSFSQSKDAKMHILTLRKSVVVMFIIGQFVTQPVV